MPGVPATRKFVTLRRADEGNVMDLTNILGLSAGVLTTIAFVPQLSKTYKSKCADDVSLTMLGTFCSGVFLWLIYGFWIHVLPIILANMVTLVLASLILILKLKYAGEQGRKGASTTDG